MAFEAQTARDLFAAATWAKLEAINVSEVTWMPKGADDVLRFVCE